RAELSARAESAHQRHCARDRSRGRLCGAPGSGANHARRALFGRTSGRTDGLSPRPAPGGRAAPARASHRDQRGLRSAPAPQGVPQRDAPLNEEEAVAESPALLRPFEGLTLAAWVGSDERPEYLRQSALIANIWSGLGAATRCVKAPGRHHYDVIDDLSDPESALTAAFAP